MTRLNETHDAARRSLVASANEPGTDFPIQNLPFGMFSTATDPTPRPGVALGDQIVDLGRLQQSGAFSGKADAAARAAAQGPGLDELMALGNGAASELRAQLSALLSEESTKAPDVMKALVPMSEARMHLPSTVRNFTDFLTSSFHFTRLRPDGQLSRTFMGLPIAYHSRASSVRLSGDVVRPHAISERDGDLGFAPSTQLDYELEVGIWVGPGNALGDPIRIEDAADRIFGFCLLNDWSVRDAQWFESQPLGPFLAKSVSTTISPWIVTEEALRPYRTAAFRRAETDLKPLPHLLDPRDQAEGGLDVELTASLLTPAMRARGLTAEPLTRTNARHLYWTFAQMLTHHSSNGCNMLSGDLLGSGTVSGPTDGSRACLAEMNGKGTATISLSNGEERVWLEDGDEVILTGRATREGHASIGFGTAAGKVQPATRY
jgi:fumarylacetoacetase